jgi:hypothetical protein
LSERFNKRRKRRYLVYSARPIPGITFIRYAQSKNIGKLTNLKVWKENPNGPKENSHNRLRACNLVISFNGKGGKQ